MGHIQKGILEQHPDVEINPCCLPNTNAPLDSFTSSFSPKGWGAHPAVKPHQRVGVHPSTHPPSQQAWNSHPLPILQPVAGWEGAPSQDHTGQGHGLAREHTDHGGCKSYFWGCLKEGKGNQYESVINWPGTLRRMDLDHLYSKVWILARHKPALIPLPQESGDIRCSLGPCHHVKPKRAWKGIAQTLPWGC